MRELFCLSLVLISPEMSCAGFEIPPFCGSPGSRTAQSKWNRIWHKAPGMAAARKDKWTVMWCKKLLPTKRGVLDKFIVFTSNPWSGCFCMVNYSLYAACYLYAAPAMVYSSPEFAGDEWLKILEKNSAVYQNKAIAILKCAAGNIPLGNYVRAFFVEDTAL